MQITIELLKMILIHFGLSGIKKLYRRILFVSFTDKNCFCRLFKTMVEILWLRSHLSFFYHSKRKFTMVNRFFNVTGFSHFTMVNATLVCCVSNGGRMRAKFTIVKPSQKAWFIARLSKLCLFMLHVVTNFEKHFS